MPIVKSVTYGVSVRIEVRTCNQVRVMIELSMVKSQRRIINGDHSHFQVSLTNGKTMDIENPISDIPFDPDIDITKKFLNRLSQRIATENDKGVLSDGTCLQSRENHKV